MLLLMGMGVLDPQVTSLYCQVQFNVSEKIMNIGLIKYCNQGLRPLSATGLDHPLVRLVEWCECWRSPGGPEQVVEV